MTTAGQKKSVSPYVSLEFSECYVGRTDGTIAVEQARHLRVVQVYVLNCHVVGKSVCSIMLKCGIETVYPLDERFGVKLAQVRSFGEFCRE